jgi:peptidoglycan/LPS O-acetylase OafA/YrhL
LRELISKSKNRNDGIDLIRGLSIISVILLHINISIPFDKTSTAKLFSLPVFNILFRSGYYGVIVFFVASGFLITQSAMKRWGSLSGMRVMQFYQIRFARIAPCLLGLLVILSMLDIFYVKGFVITTTSLEQAIFSALTFHINWLEAKTGYLPGSWDVLWSLSVEEAFYIFFPLLCLFVRSEFVFKLMLTVFIVLGPFARTMFSDNDIWSDHSYLSCMDGIAIGCLAAMYAGKFKINYKAFFFLTGLSLFVFIFVFRKQAYHLGLSKIGLNVTLLEIGIALILIANSVWPIQQGSRFTSLFRWFGKNSYEIYLTHMFIVTIMAQVFYRLNLPASSILFWYVSILLLSGVSGYLVARYFSEPLNRSLRLGRESAQPFFQAEN